jgi:DNA-binding IclR family transcriptional regulator
MLTKVEAKTRPVPTYSVPPVVRAIKVLRYIAAGNSVANQSRAARELGINRTTLLRLLHTLAAEGMIEPVAGSDEYVLGTGTIELAGRKLSSLDVGQVAGPILSSLSFRLGLSCHLGLLDQRDVLYVLRITPDVHLVSNVRIGTRLPAHASSMGRAILAHLPPGEVDRLFSDRDLFAVTDATPTTLRSLHADLAKIRASGIVDSRSGIEPGIDSIAAPVFDRTGGVVAAINVSGPSTAFSGVRGRRNEIEAAVREAATQISRRLGCLPGTAPSSRQSTAEPVRRARS